MHRLLISVTLALVLIPADASAFFFRKKEEPPKVRLSTVAELGFVSPVSHKIQFGQDGTYFDYVNDGGQDILFGFGRLSAELTYLEKHRVIFLVQPLDLQTNITLRQDLVADGTTFEAGTPMDIRYGFPFYRISYLYDFDRTRNGELAIGASLQLRNANIGFTDAAGTQRVFRRDVGPVPILKFRYRHTYESGFFVGTEIDGFYAPISYINGSTSEVVGAILDGSIRAGYKLRAPVDVFLNARYLGGGGVGTNETQAELSMSDGYTRNWLHTVAISLGTIFYLE